jgi:hypothetical protein
MSSEVEPASFAGKLAQHGRRILGIGIGESEPFRAELRRVNRALRAAGLPEHHEPEHVESSFSCAMWGYGGLHFLRRIAAYAAFGRDLPSPGEYEGVSDDPVVLAFYERFDDRSLKYRHLMIHGDAEGLYLPLDFEDVLFPSERLNVVGGMIGSSHRLRAECIELASLLALPTDFDPDAEEVLQAVEEQGRGPGWRAYGVESYTCLQLLAACNASIKTGAAIVLC